MKKRNLWINKQTSTKGSTTFPVLLGAGAIFLAGLFFMVDMPLKLILSNEMVDTVNNASASAVTRIVEADVKAGRLNIDPDKARESAFDVFARTYDLTVIENGTALEAKPGGQLAANPVITVLSKNKPMNASDTWTDIIVLPGGQEITIDESTVVVHAKMAFNPLIRKNDGGMILERFAMSEVAFPDYGTK